MKIGVCLPGDDILENVEGLSGGEKLYRKDRFMHEKGFDYCETGVSVIMALTEEDLAFLEEKKNQGDFSLEVCNGFIPGTFKIAENGTEPGLCEYVDEALKRLARLKVEYVVFGSGQARRFEEIDYAEGMHEIFEFLKMSDEIAGKYGVQIVIEPLNRKETNIIYTVKSAAHILETQPMKNVKLLADAYHVYEENESLEDLETYKADLKHVHIAECPGRKAPGKNGGEYLKTFAQALKATGYQARVSTECRWDNALEEIDGVQAFMAEYYR